MSFRRRLTLFFVLIVVVPMIALGVVVARLVSDSEHGKAQARVDAYAASALDVYRRSAQQAAREARLLASDPLLAAALRRGDARAARARATRLASTRRLARVLVLRDGHPFAALGDPTAVAGGAARVRLVVGQPGDPAGTTGDATPRARGSVRALVGVSTTTAVAFARAVAPAGTRVTIRRGPRVLAATWPTDRTVRSLPEHGIAALAGTDYAVASFRAADLGAAEDTVSVLANASGAPGVVTHGRSLWLALLGVFLLLAFAGALLVSRQLQGQLGRLLAAVRRVAGGDHSTFVPVDGDDELAALGREFNSLSGELVQVRRQAVTDELTGLFNHRRFQEVIASEAATAERFRQPLGLLMLDVDDFKRVNDTYGHPQGDEVLRAVARVLLAESREIDEPARYGGEEMAVALPQTDLEGAYVIAERVRTAVEALSIPRLDGLGLLHVTVSCGVASAVDIGKDALVADADAALYAAKRAGKNRTACAPGRAVKPLPVGDLSH
jgi:diguanylate cyclase (GGDEF)-like protein